MTQHAQPQKLVLDVEIQAAAHWDILIVAANALVVVFLTLTMYHIHILTARQPVQLLLNVLAVQLAEVR